MSLEAGIKLPIVALQHLCKMLSHRWVLIDLLLSPAQGSLQEDCDLSTSYLAVDSNGHESAEGVSSLSQEACK